MSNNFISQAVKIVQDAIQADNEQRYEEALRLYKRALDFFVTGLKFKLIMMKILMMKSKKIKILKK